MHKRQSINTTQNFQKEKKKNTKKNTKKLAQITGYDVINYKDFVICHSDTQSNK